MAALAAVVGLIDFFVFANMCPNGQAGRVAGPSETGARAGGIFIASGNRLP
jgi:hypothetical protein